ncbi:MAG: hypothetical protein V1490_03125, partial [Candidatus Omnitrophota bacterium]
LLTCNEGVTRSIRVASLILTLPLAFRVKIILHYVQDEIHDRFILAIRVKIILSSGQDYV